MVLCSIREVSISHLIVLEDEIQCTKTKPMIQLSIPAEDAYEDRLDADGHSNYETT